VTFASRLREILQAIKAARLPPQPKRRYDLVGEAMVRPFGGTAGRDRIRAGGVTDQDGDEGESRCS
jgi:hypothetical protein